jgi:anaerobic sulfite reductase subunit C
MSFEICDIDQRQPNRFALRLHAVGGQFTSEQFRTIADIADRYGKGEIHVTTRQGMEIHYVHHKDLDAAHAALEKNGILMGARGPRVRLVIACPGDDSCRFGSINTRAIAAELDRRYFRMEMPHKLKMGVTGCRHNCGKAREADIGVMGSLEPPEWIEDKCLHCNACIETCPVQALSSVDDKHIRDMDKCIRCSTCALNCPAEAWVAAKRSYTLFVGGTLGKNPRLASILKEGVESTDELFELIDRTLAFYKENGQTKERMGTMLTRLGEKEVFEKLLAGS